MIKRLSTFAQDHRPTNYLYFGLLLFCFFVLDLYHVILLEPSISLSSLYFLSYSLLQSLIEVGVLVFVGGLIKKRLPNLYYKFFISLTFLFLLVHFIDFILVRFMGMSFYFALDMVLDETFENFIEMLHCVGVNMNFWMIFLLPFPLLIPLLGILFYRITHKVSLKKPFTVSQKKVLTLLCIFPIALLVLDIGISPLVQREDYKTYQMTLPWKTTLFSGKKDQLKLNGPLKPIRDEKALALALQGIKFNVKKRPNIYLFIAESLRDDFLTDMTAPNLHMFKNDNYASSMSFSSGNGTHTSWYSIFHANYPFHWSYKSFQKKEEGSVPLQMLKKMGYEVHVYTSSQLKYYKLNQVMLGKDQHLADALHSFPHYGEINAADTDKAAVAKLLEDLERDEMQEGKVCLVFLDATHFNYSWPENYPTKFLPISDESTKLNIVNALSGLEEIKNRYRNSIHFVDSLFGDFLSKLVSYGLYDQSMIVFTGDHGEEFYEEGQLFHASHLSSMQTQPPIYYKLGKKKLPKDNILTSHIDIFPTLIHCVGGKSSYPEMYDGKSLFHKERDPFVITARYNGSRNPFEFFIHDGKEKVVLRFKNTKRIYHSKLLEVCAIQDENDDYLDLGPKKERLEHLSEHFSEAFEELFSKSK